MDRWLRNEVAPLLGSEGRHRPAAAAGVRAVVAVEIESDAGCARQGHVIRWSSWTRLHTIPILLHGGRNSRFSPLSFLWRRCYLLSQRHRPSPNAHSAARASLLTS